MFETSASLLERLRRPEDAVAWGRFINLYGPVIHTWALRAGLQAADAADLVQEVFTTLVQQMPGFSYDSGRSFRAWLKTVTLNHWRARQRHTAPVALDNRAELAGADPAEAVWEQEYQGWVTTRALQLMQTDFEPHIWRACWLTAAEGRTPAEVAAELGMSVGAVYAARCRVLARLRQELQGLDG